MFFYHNWYLKNLARDAKNEVVRIVQEGLANIRKHSESETVRIFLYSSADGNCTGEHIIGLSVMQERAARLNGELQFESDGEGLLLQLNFKVAVPIKTNAPSAVTKHTSGK